MDLWSYMNTFTNFKFATFCFRKLEEQTQHIKEYKRLDYFMVTLWLLAKNVMRQLCDDNLVMIIGMTQ